VRYLNLGLGLLLLFLLIFPFTVLPEFIKVKKMECFSQYGICDESLFSETNDLIGQSLRKTKTALKERLKVNGSVEKFSFTFKLPGTLRIDLITRKPKFALVNKQTKEIYLIDENGRVLQKTDKTNLPKVISDTFSPPAEGMIKEDELFALNLTYSLSFFYQVDVSEMVSEGLTVQLPAGARVIFPLEGDKDTLLASLKLILSQVKGVKLIDLRFKNPIIK